MPQRLWVFYPPYPFISRHIPLCPGMWVRIPKAASQEEKEARAPASGSGEGHRKGPRCTGWLFTLAADFPGFLPLPVGLMRDGCGGWCWLVSDKARGGTATRYCHCPAPARLHVGHVGHVGREGGQAASQEEKEARAPASGSGEGRRKAHAAPGGSFTLAAGFQGFLRKLQ